MDNMNPNQQNPQNPQNPQTPQYPQYPQNPPYPPRYQQPYGQQPPTGGNQYLARVNAFRRQRPVLAGVAALIAVCVVCAICAGVVQGISGAGQTAGAVSNAGSQFTTHNSGPTATPKPTATKGPTATPIPTITPQPTVDPVLAEQQTVQHLASVNCDFTTNSVKATFTPNGGQVNVVATVGTQWDTGAAQTTVESLVFDCFKGFYTSPHATFVQSIHVEVDGPLVDAYGNSSTGLYGDADLSRTTAQPFNWNGLDYSTAWSNHIYDSQYVRSN